MNSTVRGDVQTTIEPELVPATTAALTASSARGRRWRGYVWVLPALVFYLAFVIAPAFHTVWLSFFEWNGIAPARWIGLSNYHELFTDPDLRGAIVHALILVMFFSWLPILVGLLMVGLLARHRRRGMTTYRILFFLPQVLPLVAVGITWRWMYGDDGTVNQILRWIGLGSITRAWLGDFDLALPAVGVIGTWAMTGLCMVLFLSGVQKVDATLYEAARLDGAGPVREFLTVTLPELRGEIVVAMTVTTVAALASFDIVFVTTDGGPGNQTTVPGLLVYRLAFAQREVGLAAAIGVVLASLIFATIWTIRRIAREDES